MRGTTSGLDFGTSTTAVSSPRTGIQSEVIPIGTLQPWMPSAAAPDGGRWIVGEAAENTECLRSVKMRITEGQSQVPLKGFGMVSVDDVVAATLAEARHRSQDKGVPIDGAGVRLGCPAHWVGSQRQRLASAAVAAGLDVSVDSIIDEPIAAGVAWIWDEFLRHDRRAHGKTLVVDYGGGTVDFALLEAYFGSEGPEITVLSSRGFAGAGDFLDTQLTSFLVSEWREKGVSSLRLEDLMWLDELGEPTWRHEVLIAARNAKEALSTAESFPVDLVLDSEHLPTVRLERATLEALFNPRLDEAIGRIDLVLRDAHIRTGMLTSSIKSLRFQDMAKEVRHVVLAGGMSLMPAIRRRFQRAFPKAEIYGGTDLREASTMVVRGLGNNRAYDSINLQRPAFDFILEWEDWSGELREMKLYEAFTPLYEGWQVLSGVPLRYTSHFDAKPRPPRGYGGLIARSTSGEILGYASPSSGEPLQSVQGITVPLDGVSPLSFEISPDGYVTFRCGSDIVKFRVESWPHVRFKAARSLPRGYGLPVTVVRTATSWSNWDYPHK